MTEVLDQYTAGTEPDDFAEADLPDVIAGQDEPVDLGWGFTVDPKTGEKRAKLAPGRPKKPPGAEELAQGPEIPREPDRPPAPPKPGKPQPPDAGDKDEPKMPRGGIIAKGVNKAYRRTGKVIRKFEKGDEFGVGQAFIECTKVDPDEPDDEREPTVGEAWEQLARTNPRIRAFLLKLVAGGDIADLAMAHAPIAIAVVMKPWVQRLIPISKIVDALTEEDEDEDEESDMPGGLTKDDLQQMSDLTEKQAAQMAAKARDMARRAGVHLSEDEIAAAVAKASSMPDGVPPAFRRSQPKKQTRAQRTGAGR